MATYMRIAVAIGEEYHQIHRRRQTMDPIGRKLEDTNGLHCTFKPLRYYFPTALKILCIFAH